MTHSTGRSLKVRFFTFHDLFLRFSGAHSAEIPQRTIKSGAGWNRQLILVTDPWSC